MDHFWAQYGTEPAPAADISAAMARLWARPGPEQDYSRAGNGPLAESGPTGRPGRRKVTASAPWPPNDGHFVARFGPFLSKTLQPSGCIFLSTGALRGAMRVRMHSAKEVRGAGAVGDAPGRCAHCGPGGRRVRLPRAGKAPQVEDQGSFARS